MDDWPVSSTTDRTLTSLPSIDTSRPVRSETAYFALGCFYDPDSISYLDLCTLFWHSHNPSWTGVLRQYANALFYTNADQHRLATQSAEEYRRTAEGSVRTPVRELTAFYPADASHQKRHLREHRELMSAFRALLPDDTAFACSTATTRVNAALAGHVNPDLVRSELPSYGLAEEATERVLLLL